MANQNKAAQSDISMADLGDCHLRNWGNMICAQGWPGPSSRVAAQPMFREVKSGYRVESEGDVFFDEDAARVTDQVIQACISSLDQLAALHAYYVDSFTRHSLEMATGKYNSWVLNYGKGKKELSRNSFREIIRDIKIQVGLVQTQRSAGVMSDESIKQFAQQNRLVFHAMQAI